MKSRDRIVGCLWYTIRLCQQFITKRCVVYVLTLLFNSTNKQRVRKTQRKEPHSHSMAHSCFDANTHAETLLLTHQQVRYRRCADHRHLDNPHGNLYEHQNPNGPRQFCRVTSDCLAVLLPQRCRQNLHLHPDCPTSSLALWSPAAPPPSLINGVS